MLTKPIYFNFTRDFIIKNVIKDNLYVTIIGISNIASSSVIVPDAHNAFLHELTLAISFPDSSLEWNSDGNNFFRRSNDVLFA